MMNSMFGWPMFASVRTFVPIWFPRLDMGCVRVAELIDTREEDGIFEILSAPQSWRLLKVRRQRVRLHKMVGNTAKISLVNAE